MKKIVHHIGLDVHKETRGSDRDRSAKNRYTRCARWTQAGGRSMAAQPLRPFLDLVGARR